MIYNDPIPAWEIFVAVQ